MLGILEIFYVSFDCHVPCLAHSFGSHQFSWTKLWEDHVIHLWNISARWRKHFTRTVLRVCFPDQELNTLHYSLLWDEVKDQNTTGQKLLFRSRLYRESLKVGSQVLLNWGEKVAFCLPTAGRRAQLFHLIFTQPVAHLLEIPCTLLWLESNQRKIS